MTAGRVGRIGAGGTLPIDVGCNGVAPGAVSSSIGVKSVERKGLSHGNGHHQLPKVNISGPHFGAEFAEQGIGGLFGFKGAYARLAWQNALHKELGGRRFFLKAVEHVAHIGRHTFGAVNALRAQVVGTNHQKSLGGFSAQNGFEVGQSSSETAPDTPRLMTLGLSKASHQACMLVMLLPMNTMWSDATSNTLNVSYR